MVNINRVRVALTGFPGGPGVSTFYTTDPNIMRNALHTFYTAWLGTFPDDVTYTIETVGDVIDPVNGDLIGGWSDATTKTGAGGGGTGPYAAPVGVVINWETGSVWDAHKLRGRTFMVPLVSATFQNDGSVDDTVLGLLRGYATALVGDSVGTFVVWHRPIEASAGPPPVVFRAGGFSAVVGSTVNDRAAVLRSRRA